MNRKIESSTGITMEIEKVGPEEAAYWLDQHNARNRTVSPKRVAMYVRAIRMGDWAFSGDPIRVDRDGNLIDGQHRLTAIRESGATLELLFQYGFENDAQKYFDQGRSRSAIDQLKIEGMTAPSAAAAVAKAVLHWAEDDVLWMNRGIPATEIVNYVEENIDLVDLAVKIGRRVRYATGASISLVGALYIQSLHVAPPEKVDEFFEGLCTGADQTTGSPILAAREVIGRMKREKRLDRVRELYYLCHAWNLWACGRPAFKFNLPRDGVTPAHTHLKTPR